jgi:hypothetical protein
MAANVMCTCRLRDVQITYLRSATARQKRLSASVNWDANRDPSRKLSVDLLLDGRAPWHHAGHLTLHYPGRVINAEFEFLLKGIIIIIKARWRSSMVERSVRSASERES